MDGRFIQVSGIKVYCVEHGSGSPVVMVHGNTGSSRWFQLVMDIPGCRAIAPDLPNFGQSQALPGEPGIEGYADFVAKLIDVLRLDRPVLVGHSLGGAVAISLAVRFPGLFRGLVLVDSAAPSGLMTPEDRHPLIESMRTNRDILTRALSAVVPTLKDRVFFEALVDDAARMAVPAWIGNARALSVFDYRGRCGAFTAPVLVLWGRKDVIVTEAMARETAQAFPVARLLILDDVGHSVVVEDPRRFAGILSEFVSALGKESE
ncbi:MAG: alpha/beta hydrolase [Spirochaetia bacterium]|jgi:branched-chain amino acid transport system permease protein